MPKTDNIRGLFNSIAGDYDALNHILSLGIDKTWRRRALREIVDAEGKPQRILDMACGTGDFSIAIAKKMAPGSYLLGMDITEGMLEVMRRKLVRRGLSDAVDTRCGDCLSTGLEDASFDRITLAFGIRNFPDREAGLREALRLLRPGGQLVILELSVPRNRFIAFFYKLYFKHLLPLVGGLFSGDKAAYRYLVASVLAFPGPGEWMRTMRDCGFDNVRHRAFSLGICRMYCGSKKI
ncbi:MAG: bifunctional demethylmenaquinone methyltransferase/2-methoxy-6-polyprenyl-1,4-benzoquinol methylase UbiE [Bacteroidales bacterium]|nr:bifunctional demethylmenaquinone methyltransferase/2-methoxy-6-polyprenyl-1,4-benzoquinol methylase UbiE [Bacteroidales bacterium]